MADSKSQQHSYIRDKDVTAIKAAEEALNSCSISIAMVVANAGSVAALRTRINPTKRFK
jgi:hypothetical protein